MNVEKDIQEKQDSGNKSARLENALLQTIINHPEILMKEEVIMALLNTATYWQHKIIREKLRRRRGEMDCE